jgi:hypothetical protein
MAALPFIFAGVSAVGSIMSANAQVQEGKAQEAAYNYNAQVTTQNAATEEEASRLKLRKLLGTQAAMYAKAGIDLSSGSPLLMLADTAAQGEQEALSIRYKGQNEANLQRFYGQQASKTATAKATGTLVTGLGNAGLSGYAAYNKSPSLTYDWYK